MNNRKAIVMLVIITVMITATVSCAQVEVPPDTSHGESATASIVDTVTDTVSETEPEISAEVSEPESEDNSETQYKIPEQYELVTEVSKPVTEPEESAEPVVSETETAPIVNKGGLDAAIRALKVITESGKSLVCYDNKGVEKTTVYVIVNTGGGAIRKEYTYYNGAEAFNDAKAMALPENVNDETRMIFVGETNDVAIGNPNNSLYIKLFGYVVWKK